MNRVQDCPFCTEQILPGNEHAIALFDKYPVSRGHMLIATRRHVSDFFQTSWAERCALLTLLEQAKSLLDEKFAPQGYNFGVNVGETAGQTVMHVHVHLIPRYAGDTPVPRGGVRGVIPGKQSYRA
jgi:diadenosine tetraphosphate (Ap4A) HIT family hydrolase